MWRIRNYKIGYTFESHLQLISSSTTTQACQLSLCPNDSHGNQPEKLHMCKHTPYCSSGLSSHRSWVGHVNDYPMVEVITKEKGFLLYFLFTSPLSCSSPCCLQDPPWLSPALTLSCNWHVLPANWNSTARRIVLSMSSEPTLTHPLWTPLQMALGTRPLSALMKSQL